MQFGFLDGFQSVPYFCDSTRLFAPEPGSWEVLVLYLKRPPGKSWRVETLCRGRFRYSDLKEAVPGDYGICIWMSGS